MFIVSLQIQYSCKTKKLVSNFKKELNKQPETLTEMKYTKQQKSNNQSQITCKRRKPKKSWLENSAMKVRKSKKQK